jgi:succinyl-diaminopimelate desuccinylase
VTESELKQRVVAILDRHQIRYSLEWRLSGAPFLTTGSRLIEATQLALEAVVGQRARPDTGGGTSDGRFIAPTGAEVVELGPLNGSIHKVNEHTPVKDIETLSQIYEAILAQLLIAH